MQQLERGWVTRLPEAMQARSVSIGLPVLLLLILTTLAVGHLRRIEREELSTDLAIQASNAFNRLSAQFDVYLETVQSISSLHSAGHKLNRESFAAFVDRTISQNRGIQALEWAPRVRQEKREEFEQAARNAGLTDFRIKQWTPEGDSKWTESDSDWAEEYTPVFLVEPQQGNEPAYGIDLASNLTRREAMQRARDTGRAVATARVTLAQETGEQAGFLIFVPIYSVGTSTKTITERRENLAGYAVGVFRVGDIVTQAMEAQKVDGITIRITDQSADNDRQILFDDTGSESSGLASIFEYEVGGRQWLIEFTATREFTAAKRRWDSWVIFAAGVFSSILLGIVLRLVIGRAGQVENLVQLRTEQLREANTQLEQEGRERELAQLELQAKAAELEKSNVNLTRFNKSASGRELRMIELKREINELLEASGQPARYDVTFTGK